MIPEAKIVEVTAENLSEYPQAICFINPKHETHHLKVNWLEKQIKLGLRIKLLYVKDQKRPFGFVEYVPGEHCWRSVDARGYMFLHCLWTNGKKLQRQGLGTVLLKEVEKDAGDMNGVAVLTSDKSFMANREIFEKNGYTIAAESGKEQLMVKQFRKSALPGINDWESELKKYQDLTIVYSKQCPWVARFIQEVKPVLKQEKLTPKIIELKTPQDAQHAPSLYSVFNLIHEGRLLADRNISITRFKNILKKEILT